MKRLRKLKNNAGFSLAEMLMAVLILLMVSVIVATGLPAARNAYEKTVIGANAQAMLSTAVSALRDELGTAWDVKIDDNATKTTGTYITYFKADTGTRAMLSNKGVVDDEGNAVYPSLVLQDNIAVENAFIHDALHKDGSARALVPDAKTDLYVTYDSVSYSNGIVSIDNLKVCKQKDETKTAVAKLTTDLKIRVLSVKNVS